MYYREHNEKTILYGNSVFCPSPPSRLIIEPNSIYKINRQKPFSTTFEFINFHINRTETA